ncbi:hypothetical protein F4777DRAFT_565448 [Nemania sp. FL0916]|nr:hypothetical protein F4777DRAFT_565448 [Nemania sp. FL0916]
MESLRNQLGETQEALTERQKQLREVRVEFSEARKSWAAEKEALEHRASRAELSSAKFSRVAKFTTTPETPKDPPPQRNIEESPDMVTIPRSQMKQAEARYEEKKKQCSALEAQLARLRPMPTIGLSDDQIVARWNELRDRIRSLSVEYLSKTFAPAQIADKAKEEFALLSPHWKSYANEATLASYLFRALLWRYVLRYFDTFCRPWGRDISGKLAGMAERMSKLAPSAEYQDWRIRTANLIFKAYPIDQALINETTEKIGGATMLFMASANIADMKEELRTIVAAVAELSALFQRSQFEILMYDKPGGTLRHGFPFNEELMDMKVKLGKMEVVDLLVTPSLLKREDDYKVVVKAEVTC